jgi:gas vesicle protein
VNLSQIVSAAAVMAVISGGIWGIIRSLLARDRKSVEDQQTAMWKQLNSLRQELKEAQIELGKLKERIQLTPDWDKRIQLMEEKLEKRFDKISTEFREFFTKAFETFQQKHG